MASPSGETHYATGENGSVAEVRKPVSLTREGQKGKERERETERKRGVRQTEIYEFAFLHVTQCVLSNITINQGPGRSDVNQRLARANCLNCA